jgi:ferritin-like protein
VNESSLDVAPEPASRRWVLASAASALAGVALVGCGGHHNAVKPSDIRSTDVVIFRGLLDLEYRTVAAYEAGIPLLDKESAKVAMQFLPQEQAHAGELSGLIKKAKVKPPKRGLRYDLGHPRDTADVLRLLESLESAQLAAYLAALPRLSSGPVRAALAAVLANDAQHLALVRERLHEAPAPAAFVTGQH